MEEDVFKLIYDYSVEGKLGNIDFIEKLIEIVVSNKKLEDFLLGDIEYGLKPLNKNNDTITVAVYNVPKRNMEIYPSELARFVDMYSRDSQLIFNYDEQIFHRNLLIARVILHELEHVAQNKKYNSHDIDTEAVLIRSVFKPKYEYRDLFEFYNKMIVKGYSESEINEHLIDMYKKINTFYPYNPVERMADIKTFETLYKSFEEVKKLSTLKNYLLYHYYKSLTDGYIEDMQLGLVAPTLIYCNGMGCESDLLKLPFYDDDQKKMDDKLVAMHNIEERLFYGLSVPKEEYAKIKQKIM